MGIEINYHPDLYPDSDMLRRYKLALNHFPCLDLFQKRKY